MTTLPATPAASGHRSTLVTVVAWVFLILSALATLGAVMNVLILAVTPAATVDAIVSRVTQDTAVTHLLPAPYQFMMHHARPVALIKLAWWAAVLITSVGILQRREWARRAFCCHPRNRDHCGHPGLRHESIHADGDSEPTCIAIANRSGTARHGHWHGPRWPAGGRDCRDPALVARHIQVSLRAQRVYKRWACGLTSA